MRTMRQVDPISSERRIKQRFGVAAPVDYRLQTTIGKVAHARKGQTVNLSSDGILFRADGLSLPVGALLEISIRWPVNLNDRVGLKLIVVGPIVRREGDCVAVRIQRAEFRTRKRTETEVGLYPITAELPLGLASQPSSA